MNRALRAATVGVLLFSPVVLSACSSGQVTQTATQQRDKTGAQAQVGDITIRQAQLLSPDGGVYASGDDAELQVALVNGGSEDDTLVSVDGNGFSSAEISSSGSSSSSSSGSSPFSSGSSSSGSASATSSAAPTGAAPTGSAAAPTSGAPVTTSGSAPSSSSSRSQEIVIPAGQSVFVGENGDYTITLTALSKDLTPGQYLEVTLTFEKAGEVTIPVTVANPTSGASRSSTFNFNQEGGAENAARSSEAANK